MNKPNFISDQELSIRKHCQNYLTNNNENNKLRRLQIDSRTNKKSSNPHITQNNGAAAGAQRNSNTMPHIITCGHATLQSQAHTHTHACAYTYEALNALINE